MTKKNKASVSIRIRLDQKTLDLIDELAGANGRQRFIKDAILWRLDEELPPMLMELAEEINQLKTRVDHLETEQSTSVYLDELNDLTKTKVCRDDLDRKLLAYFLQHEGATTPELALALTGSQGKRRTILDRLDKINERAKSILGVEIVMHRKGIIKGKRGAWWLVNKKQLV
jgi:tetrahydromethanopterin S-methyltransferase subunit G